MFSILLAIIYLSFISLGLPDCVLGSAWPAMYKEFAVPVSYAGILSMITAGGTIISSLFSGKINRRFGAGKVTAFSVALTAIALFGYSKTRSFYWLLFWAVPYGLGAGSVDAALNNFVALHFKAKHMSWLHSFWGIGATLGPYIIGFCLSKGLSYRQGYFAIAVLQVVLTVVILLSLPLWKKVEKEKAEEKEQKAIALKDAIKIKGVKHVMVAFLCYCGLETSSGLWAGTYLVMGRDITPTTAAKWVSLIFLGVTAGRIISGFLTAKMSDKNMIRLGQIIAAAGIVLLCLPVEGILLCLGLLLLGLGCAPVYPSLIHATPGNFGRENSQSIIGLQMAFAYVGSTFVPPVIGWIVEKISVSLFPVCMMGILVCMFGMTEWLNHTLAKR